MKTISLIILLFPLSVFAGQGKELLDKFLNETQTMSASFVQTMHTDKGDVIQKLQIYKFEIIFHFGLTAHNAVKAQIKSPENPHTHPNPIKTTFYTSLATLSQI